jgi:biopolymer transport protein ExbD
MAMSATNAKGEVMVDMNTTPLIDVMLVMLTLLIITLPLQTHAVKLNMPFGESPPVVLPTVELGVDFDGSITWNGTPISRATMDAYLADIGKKPAEAQDEIHVNSNRLAKYDAVSKVLADAQRLGAVHIGFNGIDQYN